jgi:membrane-associated phospholipid phosphatase
LEEKLAKPDTNRKPGRPGAALIHLVQEVGPFALIGLFGALGLLIIFGKLAEEVFSNEITSLDNGTSLWMHSFANPALDTGFAWLSTGLGVIGVIALSLILFAVLFWRKHPYDAWRLALVMIGGLVLNQALKFIFQRSRPQLWPGSQFAGYSFPSGHAMLALCLFGMLAWLSYRYLHSHPAQIAVTILCGLLIFLIGLSRIYRRTLSI